MDPTIAGALIGVGGTVLGGGLAWAAMRNERKHNVAEGHRRTVVERRRAEFGYWGALYNAVSGIAEDGSDLELAESLAAARRGYVAATISDPPEHGLGQDRTTAVEDFRRIVVRSLQKWEEDLTHQSGDRSGKAHIEAITRARDAMDSALGDD